MAVACRYSQREDGRVSPPTQCNDSLRSKTNVQKQHALTTRQQQAQPAVAHQSNRDDLRFALRNKMSQRDYVDREMKNFHYSASMQQMQTVLQQQ